jgi:hypothetical protein
MDRRCFRITSASNFRFILCKLKFRFLRIKRQTMKLSLPFQQILVSIGIAILVRSCPTFILFGTRSEKSSAVRDTEFNFRRDIHSIRFPFGCVSLTTALSAKSQRTNASFIWRVISKMRSACITSLFHRLMTPSDKGREKKSNQSVSQLFYFPLSCLITVHRPQSFLFFIFRVLFGICFPKAFSRINQTRFSLSR